MPTMRDIYDGNVDLNYMIYPDLSRMIVAIAFPEMHSRRVFQTDSLAGVKSNARTYARHATTLSALNAVLAKLGDAQNFPLDFTKYEAITAKPDKFGRGTVITREMIEDCMLPLIQDNLTTLGLIGGNTVDQAGAYALEAGVTAAFTRAATGKSISMTGNEFTRAGTFGQFDVVDSKKKDLASKSYVGNTLFINPSDLADLEKLPMYAAASEYGTPNYREGSLGRLEGLDIFESVNVRPVYTAYSKVGFVLAVGGVPNVQKQYTPLGFYAEKRPITVQTMDFPPSDCQKIFLSTRFAYVVTRPEAIGMLYVS